MIRNRMIHASCATLVRMESVTSGGCAGVPAELREGIGWPIARAAHAVTQAYNAALAASGLSLRTYAVLAYIGTGRAGTQLAIAQGVGLDKTTLVATIDELERRGLVRRTPDPNDRRARIVGITGAGREVLSQAAQIAGGVEARLCACVDERDATTLKSTLIALIDGPLRERGGGSCC